MENVINEIYKMDIKKVMDFEEQLSRYSCFMCFTVLAAAAEGNHFSSIKELKKNIEKSINSQKIQCAEFENISVKSRISILLMKRKCYSMAFYFLNLCKNIRRLLKR